MTQKQNIVLFTHDDKLADQVKSVAEPSLHEMLHISQLKMSGAFDQIKQAEEDPASKPVVLYDTNFNCKDALDLLSKMHHSSWIDLMLISNLPNEGNMRLFAKYNFLNHIIGRNNPHIEDEIKKCLSPQEGSGQSQVIHSLIDSDSVIESLQLKDYRKRDDCLNAIYDAADELNCFPDFPGMVTTAAAEMIMNAFFHAPFDPKEGKEKYAHLPRSHPLVLEDSEQITINFGASEKHFIFSVSDPFGRLQKSHIAKCFNTGLNKDGAQVKLDGQTGGVGFYLTVNSISQMVVQVQPNLQTEVACVCLRSKSRKKFETSIKSIHFFEQNEEQKDVKVA